MGHLWGTTAPIGADPLAWGSGSPAQAAVAAYEVHAGDGSPRGHGPPTGGTGSPAQEAVAAYGAPTGDGSSQWPGLAAVTAWGSNAAPHSVSTPVLDVSM